MECTTCEQWVLAELAEAQERNAALLSRCEALEAQAEILERGEPEPDAFAAYCLAAGRRAVARACAYPWRCEGEPPEFGEWCDRVVAHVPDCIGRAEFVREMEPELREIYGEARKA